MQAAPSPPPRTHASWPWALGVQCWLVWVIGPRLFRRELDGLSLLASALPLLVLVAAYFAERRGRRSSALTLGAFPVSLALATLRFDPEHALSTYSPAVLTVGAVSLLAYAAVVANGTSERERQRPCSVHALSQAHQPATDPRRALGQRGLLAGAALAFLALILGSGRGAAIGYHEAWGQGAAAGATLAAVVAGLTGSVAMAGIVGPALRAERPRGGKRRREQRRNRRVGWSLAVALSGVIAYALLWLSTR